MSSHQGHRVTTPQKIFKVLMDTWLGTYLILIIHPKISDMGQHPIPGSFICTLNSENVEGPTLSSAWPGQ
jgi:hypothetical protein